jgi:hypothetical protein
VSFRDLMLARVCVALYFGSVLGLVGVWVCCLCGFDVVIVGFRPVCS